MRKRMTAALVAVLLTLQGTVVSAESLTAEQFQEAADVNEESVLFAGEDSPAELIGGAAVGEEKPAESIGGEEELTELIDGEEEPAETADGEKESAELISGGEEPAETAGGEIFTEAVPEAKAAAEITLYALSESEQEYLSIPSGYPQNYDLGKQSGRVTSGKSVVIENHIVKPAVEIWYYYPGPDGYSVGSTNPTGNPGEYQVKKIITGDSAVTLDDGTELLFHVESYAVAYSEGVIDRYLAENITPDMTDYQKAELCCRFVAGYDYGTGSSSCVGMIVTGAGDCWASTDALLCMLGKLGITCKSHNGSFQPGAGVNHENVMAKLDGENYILDAGFDGKAPRYYSITRIGSSPFAYKVLSSAENTAAITDYADMNKESHIEIPESIDGYTITEIADGAFSNRDSLVHITIPDTVEKIGKRAFENCDALETVTLSKNLKSIGSGCFFLCGALRGISIPASVTEIASNCFYYCESLEKIETDAGNAAFSSADGVLFDKEKTKLIAFPAGKRPASYTVPASVRTIGGYAFCNAAVKSLKLPDGLRQIEPYAFADYGLEKTDPGVYVPAELDPLVLPSGITSISSYAFKSATIEEIVLAAGVRRIEDYAFYQAKSLRRINFPQGLEYIGEGAFAGIGFADRTFMIPKSVKQIGAYAFHLAYGWGSLGGGTVSGQTTRIAFEEECDIAIGAGAFSASTLLVSEGSPMHRYAEENSVPFEVKTITQMYDEMLRLKLSNEKDGIALSWSRIEGVSLYRIFRKKQGESSFKEVMTTDQTSWKDTGVKTGAKYVYRFEFAAGGETITPAQVSLWRLAAPEDVRIEYENGLTSIYWKPAAGVDEYHVYYLAEGRTEPVIYTRGTETTVGSGGMISWYFSDSGTKIYDVWIAACRDGDEGIPTEVLRIKPGVDAPANLKAQNTASGVKLKWDKVSSADGYFIYRKSGSGSYKKIASIKNSSTSAYTDKAVKAKNGSVYSYAVKAYRGDQSSAACKTGGKIVRLTAPAISRLKSASKKLRVTWKKNAKADGYQIQYAASSSFKNASAVKISSAKTVSAVIKNLKKKKTYYVRVRSFKKSGGAVYYSAWSSAGKIRL